MSSPSKKPAPQSHMASSTGMILRPKGVRGRAPAKPTDSRRSSGDGMDLERKLLFIIEHGIIFPVQTNISELKGMRGVTTK